MNFNNPRESSVVAEPVRAVPPTAAMAQSGENASQAGHFQTDHLLANLGSRTVSSGFITITSQVIQFLLTLGSTMILARLLMPRDFGLLAMVWTVMGFLQIFKDAGLSTATVQREGITHTQVSNLFWVNVAVGGVAGILVAASAPLVAWFYREPRLVPVSIALSSTFLMAGLAVQHRALLSRQMRFKAIAVIQVGSTLAGVVAGVGMAWLNYGYWSLVWMNLITKLAALIMTWSALSWRPQFFRRHSGTRSLLHFGANLTAGTFIYSLARGMDALLIGRCCGAGPLGLYSRASGMLTRPLDQFLAPIEAVVIPTFSRLQGQPERYRLNFMRLYEGIALGGFFFTGMFFALAHPLTMIVLGPKWEKATVIFAALSFAALQAPLGACSSWLITSQGRGRDSFSAGWIIAIVIVVSFVAGLPFGPAGVAIAYAAGCMLIQTPIYYWLVGRTGPIRTSDLWIGFLRHLPVWVTVTLTAWLMLKAISNFSPLIQLVICIPISFVAGIAFIGVYAPSRRVAGELISLLRELARSSKSNEIQVDGRSGENDAQSSLIPGFTVIIPTFNREHLVKRAITSVLNQTLKADQIIVVDDGSTDGTQEMCRQFSNAIEYVRQANAGVAEARNRGIKLARHAWIAFLDSDDHWTPTHLERMKAAITETGGKARFYFSDVVMVNGNQNVSLWSQIGFKFDGAYYLLPDATDWMLSRRLPASIQSSVFNAAILKGSTGFDRRVEPMEDTELFCRLGISGAVCAVNSVGCFYSADDSNNRLTAKVNVRTENYWKCTCMLWSLVRVRFPHLHPAHRGIIEYKLANSHWRLMRHCWKAGKFPRGLMSFLRCVRTQASYPLVRLRKMLGGKHGAGSGPKTKTFAQTNRNPA